jgi:PAS domain S-box-containing protein
MAGIHTGQLEGGNGASRRFEIARDLVSTSNEAGYFLSLNVAWEETLGWSRQELMSRPISDFLHPADLEPTLEQLARIAEADLEVTAFENRFRHKDGHWVWLWWEGQTDGRTWIGLATDVSTEHESRERIESAIASGRLLVYAQPIVDQRSGACVQEELLVRLRENGTVLGPDSFLAEAEQSGVISRIDRWMAERAAELAAAGRSVAINLSPATVADDETMAVLRGVVGSARDAGYPVSFELTETAALASVPAAKRFGDHLRACGGELALDDFGTGSGSFTHLLQLPITTIKIDRSFIASIVSGDDHKTVCGAIADVARRLEMTTVAEGVEDAATLDCVRSLQIDRIQGYLVGRPAQVGS